MDSSAGNYRKNEAFTRQPLHHHALMRSLIHFKGELVISLVKEKSREKESSSECELFADSWTVDRMWFRQTHRHNSHLASHDMAHGFPNHREKISRAFVAKDVAQQKWIQLVHSPAVQKKQISVCWLQWLWLYRRQPQIPVNSSFKSQAMD